MALENIEEVTERHLHILWTSADPITAENMILMYARNAMLNRWWDKVTVILWGASQQLILDNNDIYEKIKIAKLAGVEFSACISCAINSGIVEELKGKDIELIRWGEKLSLLMQNNKHLLTI